MVNEIDGYLKNDNYVLSYAFNAVGKTRLSQTLVDKYTTDEEKINVLCYNAFLEDEFVWDNDNCTFNISSFWITQLIIDEGLENDIAECFKNTINKKIEPRFDFKKGTIEFIIPTGDSEERIKISKGEETIFKWVMFYVIFDRAIDTLSDDYDDRSTHIFDDLKHVIIDDPVSSIDDYRIYTIAIQIQDLLKKIRDKNSKTLVRLLKMVYIFRS